MLLVPSIMQMLGKANWWLPGWLDRILPHLSVEGDATPPVGNDYLDPDLFMTRAERKAAKAGEHVSLPGQKSGEAEEDAVSSSGHR
jgi:hypothetical protein